MQTDFGAISAARKKIWAAEAWKQGRDESFWFSNAFVGANENDMNRPITRVTKLTKTERGLECIMQLVADLQGDGVAGDNLLEGNEEAMFNDAQTIRIDQLRNGVRSKGRVSEQATVIRFRTTGRDKLGFWMAEKIDEMGHLTVAGRAFTLKTNGTTRVGSQLPQLSFANDVVAASTNRIIYAGSATSEANLTAADKMSWNLIVKACAFAKRKKIKPIRQGGRMYYALLLSTEQLRDLQQDADYQTIVKTAGARGTKNPLFNNAVAVVQGVVIYDHNKVFCTLGKASGSKWGSGGTIDGAQAQLFGAQAMGFATIGDVDWEESDNTDYKARPGIAVGRMLGMLKPQFRSEPDNNSTEDFGTVAIKTAAAA